MESIAPSRLSVLGHPQRLALFRLLMRRYPDRVPAGELAEAMDLKASTLSAYLSALMRAGLVSQERAGTSLRYSVDMAEVRRTFDYLLLDCCRGRPELCAPVSMPLARGARALPDRKLNVLFICTGNSARSIFAEALLRKTAGDRFNAFSAGTSPAPQVNPFAVRVLAEAGHDLSALGPRDTAEFLGPDAPQLDIVVTVCNRAANAERAAWQGQPVTGHWGMPDPDRAEGGDDLKARAFRQTYDILKRRIERLAAMDLGALDPVALQAGIDEIGRTPCREIA